MKRFFRWMAVPAMCVVAGLSYAASPVASERVFSRGDMTLGALVGYGDGFSQKVAFEYCVYDNWLNNRASLGIGGAVGNCIGDHWDRLSVEVTGSFHYQFTRSLDTYATVGIGGGYRFYDKFYGSDGGIFSWTTCAGARWYFTRSFAVNIEAGYSFGSYILAGVNWRF